MDPLLVELGKQGIGFVLLAILGLAYIKKDRALADAYQKRVDDNHKLATVIEATNAASKALEHTSENRSKVIETVGELSRAGADAIKVQTGVIEQIRLAVDINRSTLAQMNTQIQHIQHTLEKLTEVQRR